MEYFAIILNSCKSGMIGLASFILTRSDAIRMSDLPLAKSFIYSINDPYLVAFRGLNVFWIDFRNQVRFLLFDVCGPQFYSERYIYSKSIPCDFAIRTIHQHNLFNSCDDRATRSPVIDNTICPMNNNSNVSPKIQTSDYFLLRNIQIQT